MRRTVAALALAVGVLVAAPQAQGGGVQVLLAVPINNYASPVAVVTVRAPVTFVNADIGDHDVVALDAKRPDGSAPWCVGLLPGTCPLFWSELISTGTTPVLGLEDARPGVPYHFTCSIHSFMKGTLVVAP